MRLTNHLRIRGKYLLFLFIAVTFLLGILANTYIPPLIANLYTPKINNQVFQIQVSPSPTASPSSSPTPTPSTVVQTKQLPKQVQPSERALKVAGTTYALYTDESKREKIRAMAGIPKSNENTEIIQYALWFDKNPGYLAKIEAAIEEYKLQQLKTQINVPPPLPAQGNLTPLRCTSNTIGDYTYTNCY